MNVDRFCRGTIFGALIGDCYGFVYEDKTTVQPDVPIALLRDTISADDKTQLIYTDDTQLAMSALRSLRRRGGFDAEDMAKEFAHAYFTDGAHRYYGGSIGFIFKSLEHDKFKHPFDFAAKQFNGSGSFGNGGGMRAAPLAIYSLRLPESDFERLIVDITRLTHTHPLAVYGALLIAFAVRNLWNRVSVGNKDINAAKFLDDLLVRLADVRYEFVESEHPSWKSAFKQYAAKFETIKELLSRSKDPTVHEIVNCLGNDLRAINSIPTAIYVFLRSLRPINGIPFESIPLRCLVFGISLGGDTDTISTMACALAGGFTGIAESEIDTEDSPIPARVLSRCESIDTIKEYAQWLSNRCSD
ncbi:Poly(ADP-ribose) glycohydrolase ARH3 [Fasciolopsis buskii]|uniref:ADP-ribosylhydrolase ARH3 n=1 Tax=Fasciolopsis buskii TaxID=27845 RepID=A0A8E0RYD6_9TREM|nr:Poly(ADP-ribose) glycohydrolase ARH3 [Fasciolopsis buski]